MLEQWSVYVNAGVPVTWLSTHEEARAEVALCATTLRMPGQAVFAIWSVTSGEGGQPGWEQPPDWPVDRPLPEDWVPSDKARQVATPHGAVLQATQWCVDHKDTPVVMVVRDAHSFVQSPQWRRAIKDATRILRGTGGRLVLLSHISEVPSDMRADVPLLLPGLPSRDALLRQCRDSLSGLGVDTDPEAAADALRGLGLREAKDAILVDFVSHDDVSVERLAAYKAQELTKVPGVKFVGDVESIEDVGGLEVLVGDLRLFQGSLTQDALDFGCDEPRGFMVCGVPGCGKTLFGSAASSMLGLPLVIFNPSECEGGIVGETGDRMRAALRTIDAVSPCVVLIDEGEKAFGSGGERDSGSKETLRREFLMWANDRKSRVFVVMTCNDATAMPPEMKRAKRWDETYFVDLPHAEERAAIIRVHLRRRQRQLADSDVDALVEATDGFTGAELEAGIAKAVRVCYTEGKRELRPQDVAAQYERIVPQSQGEQIKALRAWAKEANAVAASRPAPRSRTRKSKRGTAEPKKPAKLVN